MAATTGINDTRQTGCRSNRQPVFRTIKLSGYLKMMKAVFAGIGFDILVALAGFGNRIGLDMAAVCSVFYWNGKVQAAFGVSGSLLA